LSPGGRMRVVFYIFSCSLIGTRYQTYCNYKVAEKKIEFNFLLAPTAFGKYDIVAKKNSKLLF
jgi:hypothetical protein